MMVFVVVCFIKNTKKDSAPLRDYIVLILFLLNCSFLLGINVVSLSRGGIYLLFEKETDQIQIVGSVEEITTIDTLTGARYKVEGEYRNSPGDVIVVDKEKYYIVSCGETKVGDSVRLTVLPKSHYVLELENVIEWDGGPFPSSPDPAQWNP